MQTYTTKRKTTDRANEPQNGQNLSKSEMLHLSQAGAPQPMSPALREKFEPGFSADFSNIRISRGHIPEEMGVQAVAQGTDILLDSHAGMDVLGHELAHVVQQAQGRVAGGFPVVENAALEHEADVMGSRVSSGLSAQIGGEGGFGGETMSIAPMSGASAPAQCKSIKGKNKNASHESAVNNSSGFVSSRVSTTPHALGPDTLLKVQQNAGGVPLPAAAMQAAKNAGERQSPIFQASGLRDNTTAAAKAVRQRAGNSFNGLSDDIKDWGMGLKSQGLDWGKIKEEALEGNEIFGGQGFKMSSDISALSSSVMDIYNQYFSRPEIQQYFKDRYSLLTGTDVFDENADNGTELDYMMTDIMNRDLGLNAFAPLKTEITRTSADPKHDESYLGASAVNSFITRLPNLVRDMDMGKIDMSIVPDHMLPAIDRYKQIRGTIGQLVDPSRYDPATGARAQAAPAGAAAVPAAPAAAVPAAPAAVPAAPADPFGGQTHGARPTATSGRDWSRGTVQDWLNAAPAAPAAPAASAAPDPFGGQTHGARPTATSGSDWSRGTAQDWLNAGKKRNIFSRLFHRS